MPSSFTQAVRRDPGAWLIVATACVAFFGVAWLGFYYDDFSNISIFKLRPFIDTARDGRFNRFPLFALGLYPLMLMLPAGLSHVLIAAAHTLAAVLLRSVLRKFGYSERVAVSAALLFLLAPAHTEALHWVVASTIVFGVCFLLASLLALMDGRYLAASLLALAGMLFSEALILPSAALHALVLLQRRTGLVRIIVHGMGLAASYAAFLVVRFLVSTPGHMAQYDVGLSNAGENATDLLMMSVGMMTSRDINWIWNHAPVLTDVGLRLPPLLLLPAVVLMGGAVYVLARLPGGEPGLRGVLQGLGGVLVGLTSAVGIFLIVTGNTMQPRYTYLPLVFLAFLAALLLALLDRGPAPRALGMVALVAVLGWSLYRAWSHVWSNWYPARLVVDRVLRDVDTVVKETGASEIYVVNAPRLVGNAYVFNREWAYVGAGEQLLSRRVVMRDYPETYKPALGAGVRFTQTPCVFIGWQHGQRVVSTRAFEPMGNVVLDCEKGLTEAPDASPPVELRYASIAEEAYREMMGEPTQQLTRSEP